MPVSLKDCEELHPSLLASTAQYRVVEQHSVEDRVQRPGKTTRAMARAQADQEEATPIELAPVLRPPEHLSHEDVLNRRLRHVRELKVFYSRVCTAMLAHVVDLAGAMKQAHHPVLHPVLHDLDLQVPRTSDLGRDGSGEPAACRKESADGVDEPGKEPTVPSPKATARADHITSPRSQVKQDPLSGSKLAARLEGSSKANAKAAQMPCFSDAEEEALRHGGRSKNSANGAQSPLLERLSKSMGVTQALQVRVLAAC